MENEKLKVGDAVRFRLRSAGETHPWETGIVYADPAGAFVQVKGRRGGIHRANSEDVEKA